MTDKGLSIVEANQTNWKMLRCGYLENEVLYRSKKPLRPESDNAPIYIIPDEPEVKPKVLFI